VEVDHDQDSRPNVLLYGSAPRLDSRCVVSRPIRQALSDAAREQKELRPAAKPEKVYHNQDVESSLRRVIYMMRDLFRRRHQAPNAASRARFRRIKIDRAPALRVSSHAQAVGFGPSHRRG